MLGSWLKNRRADKFARNFWTLLQGDQVQSALSAYKREVGNSSVQPPPRLAAAFHLLSWLSERLDSDFQELRKLAIGTAPTSAIGQVWQLVQNMRFQTEVARSLRSSQMGRVPVPALPTFAGSMEDKGAALLGHALL